MRNERIMRMVSGVKHIRQKKTLIIIPIIYLAGIYGLSQAVKSYIPSFRIAMLGKLCNWVYVILFVELAVIGLMAVFTVLGTPLKAGRIEKSLSQIGFRDKMGKPPLLLSEQEDDKCIVFEFYSPGISILEYEKHLSEIETALNAHIVTIDPGRDIQHVLLKTVTSKNQFADILPWDDSYLSKEEFILQIGEGWSGTESINLNVMPHLLIGGGTGSGKSMLLKLLLMQCIKKFAIVYLADFKGGIDYSPEWHEKCTMILNGESFSEQLMEIIETMERRKELLLSEGCANIKEYNEIRKNSMRRIIVACDEIAEVLDKTGLDKEQKALVNQIESRLSVLARQSRAFGIHLILATQRPDADILKGQIKNNIDCRICGKADKVLSQIILDNSDGAVKIPKDKQGMFLTNMGTLFKAYYVPDNCFSERKEQENV